MAGNVERLAVVGLGLNESPSEKEGKSLIFCHTSCIT